MAEWLTCCQSWRRREPELVIAGPTAVSSQALFPPPGVTSQCPAPGPSLYIFQALLCPVSQFIARTLTPGGHSSGWSLGTASPGASNTMGASIPGTYKERFWGCLASLNPGAGPAAAPRSPPRGNLPTTPHPRRMSPALVQPSTPPVVIQVQDSLALPPGRSSLRGLTLQGIIPVLFYVLRFLFI